MSGDSPRGTIMVVDDDVHIRAFTKMLLEEEGCTHSDHDKLLLVRVYRMTSFAGVLADPEQDHGAIGSRSTTPNRQAKCPYPLDLSVRFRALSGSSHFCGTGRTLSMSSDSVLVVSQHLTQHEISAGTQIEISIEWPFLLDGQTHLQLVATCLVFHLGASVFAASFERYQFRTMRKPRSKRSPSRGNVLESPPAESQVMDRSGGRSLTETQA